MSRPTREQVILDTLEQLLRETPLRELNVERIAGASGISRTRFYRYYHSKDMAFAALLQRAADRAYQAIRLPGTWFDRPPGQRPRAALAATLRHGAQVWFEHRAVLREAPDLWNALPEVQETWYRIWGDLVDAVAAVIRRERELGIAPPGIDAGLLAMSLLWQGERVQFVIAIDAPGAMSLEQFVDVSTGIWMRAIYAADDPEPRVTRPSPRRRARTS